MIKMYSDFKWLMVFALAVGLSCVSSCKTSESSETESGLQSTASPAEADKFFIVTHDRFTQLQADSRAEFFGCLCVAEQGTWRAWKFVQVASKGYRSEVTATSTNDIESCVRQREQATQHCEG